MLLATLLARPRRPRPRTAAVVAATAAAGLALTMLVSPPAVAEVTAKGRLVAGDVLGAGDSISSPDGHYTLVMQSDGNLVQYVGSRALWHSRTYGNPGSVAKMQSDGHFVVYSPDGRALWYSRTGGHPGAFLELKNSAAMQIVRSERVLWAAGAVNSQLDSGRKLQSGWSLQSPNGNYLLAMQTDGNFVLYSRSPRVAIWHSKTFGNPGSEIVMQADGNLVIYAPGRGAIWSTATYRYPGTMLRVEDTGRIALYARDGSVVWATQAAGEYVINDRDDIREVKSVAFQMAADRGWGAAEQSCVEQLWERESGWRWNADNPYSTAYGIPQALPGSKMASEGPDWLDNPVTQIAWGYGYIEDRYDTPCGAWTFFKNNGWYQAGE